MAQDQFQREIQRLNDAIEKTIRTLAVEAVKFIKAQMDKEQDIFGKPYARRAYSTRRQRGKKVLQDRGNLKSSIQVKEINPATLTIKIGVTEIGGADVLKYASLHNEGATIVVTEKMKKFFWAKYYEAGGGEGRDRTSDDASFWKSLALKKVGSKIKFPKRLFLAESPLLINHLNKIAKDIFKKFYK